MNHVDNWSVPLLVKCRMHHFCLSVTFTFRKLEKRVESLLMTLMDEQHIRLNASIYYVDFLSMPQSGVKNVKTFGWDHRLQRQFFALTGGCSKGLGAF